MILVLAVGIAVLITWNIYLTVQTSNNHDEYHKTKDTLDDLKDAVNPGRVPEGTGRIENDDGNNDDDGGSNDDDNNDTRDSTIQSPVIAGKVSFSDKYDKHGVLEEEGYVEFGVPVSVHDEDITVLGGGVSAESLSNIKHGTVCASQTSGIAKNRAIGYNGNCLEEGFSTYESWPMSMNVNTIGLRTFGITNTTTGFVYPNAAGMLAFKIGTRDSVTNEFAFSSEAIVDVGVFSFSRHCSIAATVYPGSPDHFVVVWEEQAGTNGLLAATCAISTGPPTVTITCTAAPVALNAGVETVPKSIEYVSATEFAVTYIDTTNGASVVALSSATNTLVTTWGTPLVLDATVVSAECHQFDSFVRASQVVSVYADASVNVPTTLQIANLLGTTFTSAGAATALSTSFDDAIEVEAIGSAQMILGTVNDVAIDGYFTVYTLTPTGVSLPSANSVTVSMAGDVPSYTTGSQLRLTAVDENVVVAVYHSTDFSFSENVQAFELFFDGANPYLAPGDVTPFYRSSVDAVHCSALPGADANAFTCAFLVQRSLGLDAIDTRALIGEVGEFTTIHNGRHLDLVHTAPHMAAGISTTAAAAGEKIYFLNNGDLEDSDFNFPGQKPVCLHCDGSLRSARTVEDIYGCKAVCSCVSTSNDAIHCDSIAVDFVARV